MTSAFKLDELDAVSVHTYLGGMEIGVRSTGARVVRSVETWVRAQMTRAVTTRWVNPASSVSDTHETARLVFANPPCSRFSSQSCGCYATHEKHDVRNFSDFVEIFDVTRLTGAEAVWWETGPLLRSNLPMAQSVADRLEEIWQAPATTVVTKIDLRWCGVPQFRPRCHVVHLRGVWDPPEMLPHSADLPEHGIRRWVDEELEAAQDRRTLRVPHHIDMGMVCSPSSVDSCARQTESFMTRRPRGHKFLDAWSLTVLSGRPHWWVDSDEWWTVEEYAALMRLPPAMVRIVAETMTPRDALMMMSKGVSPTVTRWVGQNVLERCSPTRDLAQSRDYGQFGPRAWVADCVLPTAGRVCA